MVGAGGRDGGGFLGLGGRPAASVSFHFSVPQNKKKRKEKQ